MSQTRRLYGRQGILSFGDQPGQFPPATEHTVEDGPRSRPAKEGYEWRREHVIDYEKGVMGPQWIEVPTAESLQKQADLAAFLLHAEIEALSGLDES